MSEFDKLKDDAEQYAQQHPEQVKKGEEAVEERLGMQQDDGGRQDADDHGQQDAPADNSSGQEQ